LPSHFSDIGFEIASSGEILKYSRTLPAGTPIYSTAAGDYVRWAAGGGAELWFERSPEGALVGMNPHFDTQVQTRARLTSRQPDPTYPLDGAFHLWLDPQPVGEEGDVENGASPLLVDVPDYRTNDALVLPAEVDLAIAAFAHTLEVFASEAEMRATGSKMATESLIPSGLFFAGGGDKVPARAEAILYGTVEATELRHNDATGRDFVWARVKTWGCRLEIVADPALAPTLPTVGGIVGGTFWMSARIVGA
jgi:hypothetical protein